MAEIPASELQREGQQDIFKLMDHRAPYDFGADALLSDGAYYPNAVKDFDGNWYDAVILGNQVWMAQNLRTTHFADGTEIEEGVTLSSSVPYYKNLYAIGQGYFDKVKYGLHYNWAAVLNGATPSDTIPSGVQGIAPTGWHVPSKAEVDELVAYLNTQKRYFTGDADNNNGHLAKALAATYGWQTQSVSKAPGCNPDDNNVIGFNLPPAGLGLGSNYASSNQLYAEVYTCTERVSGYAHILTISNDVSGSGVFVMAGSCDSTWFAPVRCLCDLSPAEFRRWYIAQYRNMQHLIQVDVFNCTFNGTSTDKTVQEIYAASQEGKVVVCSYENRKYYLEKAWLNGSAYELQFASILTNITTPIHIPIYYIVYKNGAWNYGNVFLEDVVYCYTSNFDSTTNTMDVSKTPAQITADVEANKAVFLKHGDGIYTLTWKGSSPWFENLQGTTLRSIAYFTSDSKWHLITKSLGNVQSDWDQTDTSADDYIKNKPTIPTVPTNVSDFDNDAGYITASDVPQEVLVCTYNSSNNTMDKTTTEIYNAYSAGILVIAKHGESTFVCTVASETNGIIEFTKISNPSENNHIGIGYLRYYNGSWSNNSKTLQLKLVGSGTGQNIKTVNNNNLLGSGNVELGKGIVTGSATSLSGVVAQVTLNQSEADLENGVFLMISFSVDMPANGEINVANTVILNSDIMWKNDRLPANVIKSGDTCLFWYSYSGGTNVTFLLHNSRWAGLKTVNGQTLSGTGNIDIVGVCDSAEYADALTASVDGFTLRDGAVVNIRFNHGIKTNASSTYPKTLNINGTGAKTLDVWGNSNVFYYGSNGVWLVSDYETATIVYFAGNNSIPEGYYLFATSKDLSRLQSMRSSMLTSIKTVNNNSLVGSGNVTIPEGRYSDISVSDSSIDGSVYEIINNRIKCLRLTNNQTTFNIGITGVTNGFTFRVIIDNSVNVNDTVITLSTGSATNVVLSPELGTIDGRTVKAGEKIGFEFVSSSTLVVVTKLFGGSTMDEDIMYSQIPIDNDTY